MGVLSEKDYLEGAVDPERETHPTKDRILEILCACQLLRREGLGNEAPNRIVKIVSERFERG